MTGRGGDLAGGMVCVLAGLVGLAGVGCQSGPRLGSGTGEIIMGQVAADPRARSIRFPAVVNMRAGIVEYALVTVRGKIHESVFRTEVDPRDIHAAMLLLGAEWTGDAPVADAVALRGPAVRIEVSRGVIGRRRPLEDFLRATRTGGPISPSRWIYNGSFIYEGRFAALVEGSIVSLQEDPAALVNNLQDSRFDDTFHAANPKALGREGAPVMIHIRMRDPCEAPSR